MGRRLEDPVKKSHSHARIAKTDLRLSSKKKELRMPFRFGVRWLNGADFLKSFQVRKTSGAADQ